MKHIQISIKRSILWSLFLFLTLQSFAQQFDWAQSIGGLGTDVARDVTTDLEGNVIVVGSFSGQAEIAGTNMSGDGVLEAFVAKFTANGDFLWSRVITGPGEDMARGVVTDDSGVIYVVGHFTDTVTFHVSASDTVGVKGEGGKDIFIAKYLPDGTFVWQRTGGGWEDDTATDIDWYKWSGKLYVSGGFQERGKFGSAQLLSSGLTDALLLKLDADGNIHWARGGGGEEHDVAAAVAVDPTNESVYVVGDFYQQAEFGGTQLESVGSSDMFIAKYDADGMQEWVQSNGGTNVDVSTDVGVDLNNKVYVCGYYQLTTHFQTHSATALGYNDVFLTQFDQQGTCNWLSSAGSNALDNCLGMDVAWDGTTYMSGMFEDEMFAGSLSAQGNGYDVFVLNHSPEGEIRYIKTAGGVSSDFGMAACLAPDKSLFVVGYYFYYSSFDGITIGNAENGDAFVTRMTNILSDGNLENSEAESCIHYDQIQHIVRSKCLETLNIRVLDMLGRVVLEETISSTIYLNTLPIGAYLVQVQEAGVSTWSKSVIRVN